MQTIAHAVFTLHRLDEISKYRRLTFVQQQLKLAYLSRCIKRQQLVETQAMRLPFVSYPSSTRSHIDVPSTKHFPQCTHSSAVVTHVCRDRGRDVSSAYGDVARIKTTVSPHPASWRSDSAVFIAFLLRERE